MTSSFGGERVDRNGPRRTGSVVMSEPPMPNYVSRRSKERSGSLPPLTGRTGVSRDKRVQRRVLSAPHRRPKIAAVITAYNHGRYVSECALSALNQVDVDAELSATKSRSTCARQSWRWVSSMYT
jgi:hypothetical protein